jgi:alkylation response protein AidB-like acyl-CoA dehydrogenase
MKVEEFPWWTKEQRQLAREVEEFSREVAPLVEETDWRAKLGMLDGSLPWDPIPQELKKRMVEKGYFGAMIPKEYGGMGLGATGSCIIAEGLGPAYGSFVSTAIGGTHQIIRHGTKEQKERWLPKIARGEISGAIGLTEPFVGSDAAGVETFAVREGDEYVINGKKRFVTNLGYADLYIVYIKTSEKPEDKATYRHMTALIVEKGTPGFTVEKVNMLCTLDPPQLNGYLNFDDVRVPVANRIGEENDAFLGVMVDGLNFERLMICALTLGFMRISLKYAVYATERRIQFGKRTIDFESNQYRIADMITNLKLARLMTYYSAYLADLGQEPIIEATLIKIFAAETNSKAALDAMQCMGGDGLTKMYPVESIMRNMLMNVIGAGSSDIMKRLLVRQATRYQVGLMLEDLKLPRRRLHPELGVPVSDWRGELKPKLTAKDPEGRVLEALALDYKVNPGLYMTREDLEEDTDLKGEELDKVLMSLEEKRLVKLFRLHGVIRLAKALYTGLKKVKPQEFYNWYPPWVKEKLFPAPQMKPMFETK